MSMVCGLRNTDPRNDPENIYWRNVQLLKQTKNRTQMTETTNTKRFDWFKDDQVYTATEVVNTLSSHGMSTTTRTIYRWAESGDLPHISPQRSGKYRTWLFLGHDLNDFFIRTPKK